jgi:hypothetical protein
MENQAAYTHRRGSALSELRLGPFGPKAMKARKNAAGAPKADH